MSRRTQLKSTIERLIGEPLDDFVSSRRALGLSWQRIADDLTDKTDGIIEANRETLRVWYRPDSEMERET